MKRPIELSLETLREKELESQNRQEDESVQDFSDLDASVPLDFNATYPREYEPSLEEQLEGHLDGQPDEEDQESSS